jgi:enediyne biosynthesis protein E4
MPLTMRIFAILFCCLLLEAMACAAAVRQWHAEAGYRWAELSVRGNGKTGFTLLKAGETGLLFTNTLTEWEGAANRVLFNGSGVATGDFDNDGLTDVFLCGLNTSNALFKNLGGWKFKNVTREAGLTFTNKYYRGAVFADVNGDGSADLLVTTTGQGVLCFENDGKGHFKDVSATAGTTSGHGSVTTALADIDGNGTLDLYIANNRTSDIRDRGQVDVYSVRGQLVVPPALRDRLLVVNGRLLEYGEPDQLLLNDGKGRFSTVSWTNGAFLNEEGRPLAEPPRDWGLTAMFHDINGDGAPDLYVCNDYWTADRIWMNDGRGRFRAIDRLALRCTSASSMGVDFADLDRDGYDECFVVDMLSRDPRLRKRQTFAQTPMMSPIGAIDNRPQIMRNTLLVNRGDNTFAEAANFAGLSASEWSWSPVFLDVDLDGYEDVLITTGHAKDVQDIDAAIEISKHQPDYTGVTNAAERHRIFINQKMLNGRLYPRLDTPIVAFRNLGALKFKEVTSDWGTAQGGIHHGIAFADFDEDGDLDLAVNNLGAAAAIYRNESSAPRVTVRVKGLPPNTEGIGAKVKLLNGAVPVQSQEVISGGRYMSGSDPVLTFASAKAPSMVIEVRWRGGGISIVRDVRPNSIYEVEEKSASKAPAQATTNSSPPLFHDVSEKLAHSHHQEEYDDFERQPLLPRKLSQLGPGVAWCDVDGDGWDDLLIGSGRGGTLTLLRNDQKGGFAPVTGPPMNQPLTRDQAGLVAWRKASNDVVVIAGSANYQDGMEFGALARQYNLATKAINDTLPGQASTTGPLALADVDGDGDMDLFVGGRCIPGRYPEPAASMLLRNDQGQWVIDSDANRLLAKVGLVSGVVWSDLDGNGFPELVLACEWGPVQVFKNSAGKLTDATAALGLDKFTGWWSGVTAGDFDGDGELDLAVSNWGLNSPYTASAEKPLRLYFGDLNGRGIIDLIETENDPASGDVVPIRFMNTLAMALPSLPERFRSHKAYAEASIENVLGDRKSQVRQVTATTLASMVFLNRKGHFEPVELPREAQLAPAFAVNVADFDGDGREDLFLSQNFFDTQPELPRLDAGRSLLLRGNGGGKFEAIPGQNSGLRVYGEQRGAAVADFNRDGRPDLVVTQNGAATKLFENSTGKPGLRIRLAAGSGNAEGIGAVVRLKFGERFGPARELHAGSGYWSQDAVAQVMSAPETPTAIWARWPGGKTTTSAIPTGSKEVIVANDGMVGSTQ